MARRNQTAEKRRDLLPVIARAFTQLGYRRTTTAELAKRCGVQENILYRLWPDKKAMFVAAIEYVYDFSEKTWLSLLEDVRGKGSTAQRLLEFESLHHGEFGHHRILFTGLGETDDADICAALQRVYTRFHRFLFGQIVAHRGAAASDRKRGAAIAKNNRRPPAELTAWALIGLGTVANIGREVGLVSAAQRRRLIGEIGRALLEGGAA
jgi:AcrR family transcriptional regulator